MQAAVTDVTAAIYDGIAKRIGQQKFRVWFRNSTSLSVSDGYLKIGVPNLFIAGWIENHFLADIAQAAADASGQSLKITFNIDPELAGAARPSATVSHSNSSPALTRRDTDAGLSGTTGSGRQKIAAINGYDKMTLGNFVVGPSNQLAYNAASAMINQEDNPFNPLFFHGGYGLGKTHLLQGICCAMRKSRPGSKLLYCSAEEFTNQYLFALKTKKLDAFRGRFRQLELLAIDDIHFLANKPSTQEEFLYTFNSIDLAGKKVVLASDAHPKMINQLCERLVSRFVSGMVVKIEPPDFETRCRILCQRVAVLGHDISDKVISCIAEQVRTNVRELEGALLKLIAYASLNNEKPSIAMARDILAEHIARTDPIVHVSDIESAVTTFFGITPADIHSSRKDRTISLARSFSMYLARRYTKMSFPEIGRLMGNKNHATVILAARKIEELVKSNATVNWKGPGGNKVAHARTILNSLQKTIA